MSVNKLLIHGLPVIRSLDELSEITHVSKERLFRYSKNSDKYYKTYFISKKSNKKRLIAQPTRGLKAIQAWILRNILDKLHSSPQSFGFEKKSSILNNANAHSGANALLIIDLKDFFHSVSHKNVFDIFRNIGYGNFISGILANLCTYNKRLPQGGPCSPKLANLYCLNLDNRIQSYVSKKGITYTRYADDLTFSAIMPQNLHGINYFIEKIIKDEGLVVNKLKTKYLGPSQRREVTGLVLYDDKLGIGKEQYKLIRVKIHKAAISRTTINPTLLLHLNGWISFIRHVDLKRYKNLKAYTSNLIVKHPKKGLEDLIFKS